MRNLSSNLWKFWREGRIGLLLLLFPASHSSTNEGMYPISELYRVDLAKAGIHLKPEEIFSPQDNCLLRGICRVNTCTGSFVSDEGLIITNHHCAYNAIQSLSTPEQDFLNNGFVAKDRPAELVAKGYTVRITESFSDVSSEVLAAVNPQMSFLERTKGIERRCKELEKEAEAIDPSIRAEVAEMFAGKTYVLFRYTYLKDVRLVFAPPSSIGNFGGEVDNWEWPRHTGDFALLRAYTAPDGKSASYAPENIPYRPKRPIRIATEGIDEGDAVFLLGYPGKTARHKTASFLEYEQSVRLPFFVELYGWQLRVMEAAGRTDRGIALKHASQFKSLANLEKRFRGQLQGLRRTTIVADRRAEESRLQAYLDADPARRERAGGLLREIDDVYRELTEGAPFELNFEQLRTACRTLSIAFSIVDAVHERQKHDLDREPAYMERNFDQTKKSLRLTVDDLHLPTDTLMLMEMLSRLSHIPRAATIPPLKKVLEQMRDQPHSLEELVGKTKLNDWNFVESALGKSPSEIEGVEDGLLQMMRELYPHYLNLRELQKEREGKLAKAYGSLIDAKQQFLQTQFIPDANATLRFTHGTVRGYSPQDGIIKTPQTTLRGVVEKTTGVEPFDTPERVLQLHAAGDFGSYVHPRLQQVPVAMLYDTDTTGGNSGSPVFNWRGELVGVNFDRTFEATINDFAWNSAYSRSIGVDIRYCLWVIDRVYNAQHLIREMLGQDR